MLGHGAGVPLGPRPVVHRHPRVPALVGGEGHVAGSHTRPTGHAERVGEVDTSQGEHGLEVFTGMEVTGRREEGGEGHADGARDVAWLSIVSGFWIHPSESPPWSGIDHLKFFTIQVIQDVLVRLHPGSVQRGPKFGLLGSGVPVTHWKSLVRPVFESSIQNRYRTVAENSEHPPNSRRRERAEVASIVDHDVRIVSNSQISNIICKNALRWQHMIQRRCFVATLVYVKEGCTRDMPLFEFALGVAPEFG